LKLQASNDQFVSDIVDLVTIPDGIHEGWNYYDLTALAGHTGPPKYNAYRMYNAVSGGCNNIGEVALIGYEVMDEDTNETNCPIEIVYKDGDDELTAALPLG
jgi:hypothetical protein